MVYIVLDLEFNQSFPFKTGKKAEPNPECPFEIIQIGAVKLNDALEQVDTFNALIRPQIYPRLHPFVEKITKIHPEQLTGQPTFPEVYPSFLEFIGKDAAVLCTWGGDDVKSLFRNIYFHDLDADALTNQFLNIQPFASAYLNHEEGKAIGLKNAVTELGIPEDSSYHDALNDAVYTAKIFRIVRPEKIVADTFQPLTMLTKKPKRIRTNTKALITHLEQKLEKQFTEDEKKLIKMAYQLGREHTFDSVPPRKTSAK